MEDMGAGEIFGQIVKLVSDGKMTVARAIEVMQNTGKSTIANDYWADMSEQVLGYVYKDGSQVEIKDKPIYYKLGAWCDKSILENKMSDHL